MLRRPPYHELPESMRPVTHADYKPNCPECGEPTQNMGREFKPPKQNQVKKWQEAERQHEKECRENAVMILQLRRMSEAAKAK